jgi:hypothetical protein
MWPLRDLNPIGESTREPENLAGSSLVEVDGQSETSRASEPIADRPRPFETPNPEPSDAELERAIVEAVMLGAVDVARTLAARLEERRIAARRERVGDVSLIEDARKRR